MLCLMMSHGLRLIVNTVQESGKHRQTGVYGGVSLVITIIRE